LLEYCLTRVASHVLECPLVAQGLAAWRDGISVSAVVIAEMERSSHQEFEASREAELQGDEEEWVRSDQRASALAALVYIHRCSNLTASVVDDTLYYLTSAMDGDPKRDIEAFIRRV
jgi:hypothetical protein